MGRIKTIGTWYWGCGPLIALTQGFLFSIGALVANFNEDHMPTFQFSFVTGAAQALLILAFNKSIKISPIFGGKQLLRGVLVTSTFYGGCLVLYYAAIAYLPLLDALALYYLNPMLAGIFGRVLFGDPFGVLSVLGLAMYIGGISALIQPPLIFEDTQWTAKKITGFGFGVASALTAAIAFTGTRHIGERVNATVMAFWVFVLQALLSVIPFALGWPGRPTISKNPVVHLLVLVASVATATGDACACRAYQRLHASLVVVIESTQLIWGAIYGVLIFGESKGWLTVVGVALLISGIATVSLDGNTAIGLKAAWNRKDQRDLPEHTIMELDSLPKEGKESVPSTLESSTSGTITTDILQAPV